MKIQSLSIPSIVMLLAMATLASGVTKAEGWHARWHVDLPTRKPAWEFTQRMGRDVGYPAAAAEGLALVSCEHNGALLAFDSDTGQSRWKFFTAAPLRHASVASDKNIYVSSDDGHMYCLDTQGQLVWKKRGGPSNRLVLGHERLMSAWPISTEPLLHEGVLYFVAGYWPVEGIYVHAVDALTGETIWVNDQAEFRPNRRIHFVDGKLAIEGDNGSAMFLATTGETVREKSPKPTPTERPEIKNAPGNVTSWSQMGDVLIVGTTVGVSGHSRQASETITSKSLPNAPQKSPTTEAQRLADSLLANTGISNGYALLVESHDVELTQALLQNSALHLVLFEQDEQAANDMRQRLDDRGLFDDHRLAVVSNDTVLPQYFASLVIAKSQATLAESLEKCVRPYGGVIATDIRGEMTISRREGPQEGAADWTHEFHDAANTLASPEKLVKAPLGVQWYGGEAADARFYFDGNVDHQSGHGLNPQPVPAQVIEGRMILQSPGLLAAIDSYTGRIMWERPLPQMYTFGGSGGGLGIHSKKHPRPWEYEEALKFEVTPVERCRASGFNFVSLPDGIYVAAAEHLLRIDPATGNLVSTWPSPLEGDLRWGGVRAVGDTLLATLFRPQDLADAQAGFDGNGGDWAGDRMPMSHLISIDRHTGKLLWQREAKWGFLNRSGICAGDGKVYCVDLITETIQQKYEEAGREFPKVPPTLYSLDVATGEEVWSFPLDVYVQNIAYSSPRDLLLVPCRNLKEWRDGKWIDLAVDIRRGKRDKNAAGKWRALQGANGRVVWEGTDAAYHSPHIVLGDLIIDRNGYSYDLNTGRRHLRPSAEDGAHEEWNFKKGGCNHLIACENLVTWRCAYYDLESHESVNLTGMDAGCAPTLIPACGVLNIPNFGTHHKRNRMTAMALVHVEGK